MNRQQADLWFIRTHVANLEKAIAAHMVRIRTMEREIEIIRSCECPHRTSAFIKDQNTYRCTDCGKNLSRAKPRRKKK